MGWELGYDMSHTLVRMRLSGGNWDDMSHTLVLCRCAIQMLIVNSSSEFAENITFKLKF